MREMRPRRGIRMRRPCVRASMTPTIGSGRASGSSAAARLSSETGTTPPRFGRSAEQGAGIQADGVLQCRSMRPRPDSHAVGTVHKGDRPLTTIDLWPRRDKHWKDGRSAKENARAWIDASPGLQPDIAQILAACRGIGPLRQWRAEPEARIAIDGFPWSTTEHRSPPRRRGQPRSRSDRHRSQGGRNLRQHARQPVPTCASTRVGESPLDGSRPDRRPARPVCPRYRATPGTAAALSASHSDRCSACGGRPSLFRAGRAYRARIRDSIDAPRETRMQWRRPRPLPRDGPQSPRPPLPRRYRRPHSAGERISDPLCRQSTNRRSRRAD